jgi:hypothetical protein
MPYEMLDYKPTGRRNVARPKHFGRIRVKSTAE